MIDGKRGKGRPKKNGSFSNVMEFRATGEHTKMLDELAAKDGKTRGEVLREALKKYYDLKVMDQMTYF